jgi:hypothetical protein
MIPEACPFSNRQKLKLVLHGKNEVCQGHQEKNDKGEYERAECCNECQYFDKQLLTPYNPWSIPAVPYIPQPSPWGKQGTANPTPWTTVTWTDDDTGGGISTYTYKAPYGQNNLYGSVGDNARYGVINNTFDNTANQFTFSCNDVV